MTSPALQFSARSSLRLVRSLTCMLLVLLLAEAAARAEDRVPVALTLEAGVTCLERQILQQRLDVWLEEHIEGDDLTVQIRGSEHDPRTALIRLLRGDELLAQRSFSPGPPRCADFHDAVAVAISMMLRNLTTAPQPAAEPEPASAFESAPLREEETREPPASATDQVRAEAPAPLRRSAPPHVLQAAPLLVSTRASAVLASQVGASSLPGARVELSLGAGQRYAVRAGMLALFSTTQSALLADTQVRYRTRPLSATLRGCAAVVQRPSWLLQACAGLLAGRLRFHGVDAPDVRAVPAAAQPWFALEAELSLARRLSPRSWLFLSLSPVYGLRQLGVSATLSDGSGSERARLHRLGALFAVGLAFDFASAKDSGRTGMNSR